MKKPWTASEIRLLKEHYAYIGTPKLAQAFKGRSLRSISSMALRLDLRKHPERMREMGRENRLAADAPAPPSAA